MTPARSSIDWQPSAALSTLRRRAEIVAAIREFFAHRAVLEVHTPVLALAAPTDPSISCLSTEVSWNGGHRTAYLQSSPEHAMKRLLAAGIGSVYQIGPVFRDAEAGRFHNPEFTMLEWYRVGMDISSLMLEVEELVRALIEISPPPHAEIRFPLARLSYRCAFQQALDLDPFTASLEDLRETAGDAGLVWPVTAMSDEPIVRDLLLDYLLSEAVLPKLGIRDFLLDKYPVSQAALAEVCEATPPFARRFELYLGGAEIANGYQELRDPLELARRAEEDKRRRNLQNRQESSLDQRLFAAMRHGLAPCAGVALGLERLLMVLLGLDTIAEVMSFDFARA